MSMQSVRPTFDAYVVQGAPTARTLSNKNFAKMCKDCKIIDGNKLTNADMDITFTKHQTGGSAAKTGLSFEEFVSAMRELGCKLYGKRNEDKIFELIEGKKPLAKQSSTAADVVSRLTDTSKYTGSHKERFDSSGRGKGIGGRADIASNTGYVSGYGGSGTYDKTH